MFIGWDPQSGQIKSWLFNSEGGHGEGLWNRTGENEWVIKASGVLRDGRPTSATQIQTLVNKDTVKISSIDRIIGGVVAPDITDVIMVRKPPQPGGGLSQAGRNNSSSVDHFGLLVHAGGHFVMCRCWTVAFFAVLIALTATESAHAQRGRGGGGGRAMGGGGGGRPGMAGGGGGRPSMGGMSRPSMPANRPAMPSSRPAGRRNGPPWRQHGGRQHGRNVPPWNGRRKHGGDDPTRWRWRRGESARRRQSPGGRRRFARRRW